MSPESFTEQRDALFAAVAAAQRLPVDAIARSLGRHPESVLRLFVAAHATAGDAGFQSVFRLVDLLGNLGATDLSVPTPDQLDPVVLHGRVGESGFRVSVGRDDLDRDREALARLLKGQMAVDRPTRALAEIQASTPAAKTSADPAGSLVGELAEVPLGAVLELLEQGRRTGTLHVLGVHASGVDVQGRLGVVDGTCVDARAAGVLGDPAFRMVAQLTAGNFRFVSGPPMTKTLSRSAAELLAEAQRPRRR